MTTNNRESLFHRTFVTIFAVSLLAIVIFMAAATVLVQSKLSDATREELANETAVVASALNYSDNDITLLEDMELEDARITLIAADGEVLYDSEEDAASMENHASRPEVIEALSSGEGSAERASSTLGEAMLYEAVLLDDGSVIRLARQQAGYFSILFTLIAPFLGLAAVAAVVSALVARHESRRIIAPLLEVDLDHPKRNAQNAYAEMVPMLERLESQRKELKRQVRVLSDNDRMRREFTANITHELKTPLTAISGYAELIANGMVDNADDLQVFGLRIYQESGRLTALVNDILTLSNLDEAEHGDSAGAADSMGSMEAIDLPRQIYSVYQRLEPIANKNDVSIQMACEPAMIDGVPRLIDELVYNLASNGIRYNKPGGSVVLSCGKLEDGSPFVRVRDTGIGIAKEEQAKVFERFYRVDKSRSKARGGTGLGLAIVKHAAMFHGASISMDSELGVGTCITVKFKAQQRVPAALAGEQG